MNSGTASASSTLRSPLATPTRGPRTFTQYLAAIRMLGDWLVVSQVLPVNPAAAVRGPKHVVTKGATPVLSPAEARKLLASIDTGALAGLRGQALLSVMLYSFARVSAVLGMRRQDYFGQGSRGWLRLHEKGGKRHDVPVHHRAVATFDAYVEVAGLKKPKAALFQTMDPAGRRLTGRALDRRLVLVMIKRRAGAAGLPPSTCCHTFRATGITAYLSNGGDAGARAADRGARVTEDDEALRPDGGHVDGRRDRAHRDLSVDVPRPRRGPAPLRRRGAGRVWRSLAGVHDGGRRPAAREFGRELDRPDVAAAEPAIAPGGEAEIVLPQVIVDAGPQATARFLEFFARRIANARTRAAYGRRSGNSSVGARREASGCATSRRSTWPPTSERTRVGPDREAAPGRDPHARRLARRQPGPPGEPAAAGRGPKHVATKGATPVLSPAEGLSSSTASRTARNARRASPWRRCRCRSRPAIGVRFTGARATRCSADAKPGSQPAAWSAASTAASRPRPPRQFTSSPATRLAPLDHRADSARGARSLRVHGGPAP